MITTTKRKIKYRLWLPNGPVLCNPADYGPYSDSEHWVCEHFDCNCSDNIEEHTLCGYEELENRLPLEV